MQQGEFRVPDYRFKKDPDQEAAKAAYEWWKQIKREMSYQVVLGKVVYEDTHDITQLVKGMEYAPLPDLDLPF